MLAALTARSVARHKGLVAGMAVVLAGFQVLLVAIGASLQREGLFSQLSAIIPPTFQAAFGGGLIASFGGLVAFGFFHPVPVLALAVGAAYLASELAGDVEEGLVDLIAARPVSRALLVTRSVLATAGMSAALIALMLAANRGATILFAPGGTTARTPGLFLLALNLLAVTWCCGAAGLAIAALMRKRSTATGGAALVFIALYLLNFAAAWWAPARPFARLAPFHYYDAMPIMLGTHDPTRDVALLLIASAVFIAAAYSVYGRRDL